MVLQQALTGFISEKMNSLYNFVANSLVETAVKFGVYTASKKSTGFMQNQTNEISQPLYARVVELVESTPKTIESCARSKTAEFACAATVKSALSLSKAVDPMLDVVRIAAPKATYLYFKNKDDQQQSLAKILLGGTAGHIAGTYAENLVNSTLCPEGGKTYAGYAAYSLASVGADIGTCYMYESIKKTAHKIHKVSKSVSDYTASAMLPGAITHI